MSRARAAALMVAVLVFAGGTVRAASSACDKPRSDFDGLYCLNKVYQQADHDLNAIFTKLSAALNAAGRGTLRIGQLAWLRARNERCSLHRNGDFYVNLPCATNITIERTKFLEDRYRECISSGCLNSRL